MRGRFEGKTAWTASVAAIAGMALSLGMPGASFAEEKAAPGSRFEKLESVKAFDELIATLGEMRNMILSDATSEREASEGMRFLLRNVAMSQDVSGDGYPQAPHFARMDTRRRKIGGDNPDAEYDNLAWNGDYDYRITGNRGTLDHLSFTVLLRGEGGRSRAQGAAAGFGCPRLGGGLRPCTVGRALCPW